MRAISLTGAALVGLAGCGDPSHPTSGVATQSVCPNNSTLSYENFGRASFQDFCSRCHAAAVTGAARQGVPEDHVFETREQIVPEIDHLDESTAAGPAGVNTRMPPSGSMPTEAQRRQLGEWLACGAP